MTYNTGCYKIADFIRKVLQKNELAGRKEMKNRSKKFIPLIMALLIIAIAFIFYNVTLNRDNGLNIKEVNLAKGAETTGGFLGSMSTDGNMVSSWIILKPQSEITISFDTPTDINTLLLNETGYNITSYSVYYLTDGDWIKCYEQNEIGINRLATFDRINTTAIKLVVNDLKNIAFVSDIKAYDIGPAQRNIPMRVTSYITPGALKDYDPVTNTAGNIDPAYFDVITDVQFIAYGRFQQDGTVAKGTDADNLNYLKNIIGDRDVNIFITIFPPKECTMAGVYREHMDEAVASVVQYVLSSGADGADFDWEFPYGKEEYALYSEFLVKLKQELSKHGKMLSIAIAPWGGGLSQEAVEAVDEVQLMAYDLFDHNGDNNSYAGSVDAAIKYTLGLGFTKEQINLGISFYGRPTDASGVWILYNDKEYHPNKYIMFENDVYFNTITTVRDKTRYCSLTGLGGIMIFAQDEDLPMSDALSMTAQIGIAKGEYTLSGSEDNQ